MDTTKLTGHSFPQQTFQCCVNAVVSLICCRDIGQHQINVETTLFFQRRINVVYFIVDVKQRQTMLKQR